MIGNPEKVAQEDTNHNRAGRRGRGSRRAASDGRYSVVTGGVATEAGARTFIGVMQFPAARFPRECP
jgi:hypothetical protein